MYEHLVVPGLGLVILGIVVQLRVGLRDRGDRKLARHVFDHTLRTEGLDGFSRLVAERREPRGRRNTDLDDERRPAAYGAGEGPADGAIEPSR
jgi:hypothetical protein